LLKIGDKVKLDQLEGRVVSTNFIETQIKTKKGEIIHVPNSSITKKKIFIKKS
jgi:small-conductance mechanosensitive channel